MTVKQKKVRPETVNELIDSEMERLGLSANDGSKATGINPQTIIRLRKGTLGDTGYKKTISVLAWLGWGVKFYRLKGTRRGSGLRARKASPPKPH